MSQPLNLTGFSTALFSTWYFVDEYELLFDCGDGFCATMMQKSRKARNVFISHPDRDHLTGLLQFTQLNGRAKFPLIHYPGDSQSFTHFEHFARKFDPHVEMPAWIALENEAEVPIGGGRLVKAIRNEHVRAPQGVIKSLSFQVYSVRRKLKPEFHGLEGHQIGLLKEKHGEAHVTDEIRVNTLSYSGDSPVEPDGRYLDSEILIHEATFLDHSQDAELRGNRHSVLPEVLQMVADSNIKQLVLGHFSSRYENEEIEAAVRKGIKYFGIKIPVFLILPGETQRDILKGNPIN